MFRYLYTNGKVQTIDKPAVCINDLAVLRGYGVFDFLRTYNGKLFHFHDHYRRFLNSAKQLGLKVSLKEKELEGEVLKLIKKNRCKGDVSVRLMVTGGPTIDGISPDPKAGQLHILIEDIYDFPAKCYEDGVKLISMEHQRLFPESKNTNYIQAVKSLPLRKKAGAIEVLYVSNGKILEASTANFFIFKGDVLVTADRDILKGITRQAILKLAKKKFKIEERPLLVAELKEATEAFLTGTNKLVMPVVAIDGIRIGDGKVGENTRWLVESYQQYIKNY